MADSESTTPPAAGSMLRPFLSTSTVGALNELRVCADLVDRGVAVFRAVSPSSPCDLIAVHRGKTLRVEVTSGSVSLLGKLNWSRHEPSRYDVLAVVLPTSEIRYLPDEFSGDRHSRYQAERTLLPPKAKRRPLAKKPIQPKSKPLPGTIRAAHAALGLAKSPRSCPRRSPDGPSRTSGYWIREDHDGWVVAHYCGWDRPVPLLRLAAREYFKILSGAGLAVQLDEDRCLVMIRI